MLYLLQILYLIYHNYKYEKYDIQSTMITSTINIVCNPPTIDSNIISS